jgi:hypothetical protein
MPATKTPVVAWNHLVAHTTGHVAFHVAVHKVWLFALKVLPFLL